MREFLQVLGNLLGDADPCSYLFLAAFLYAAVRVATGMGRRFAGAVWWTTGCVLAACVCWGLIWLLNGQQMGVWSVIGMLLCSSTMALATGLVAAVLLPPVTSLYEGWKAVLEAQEQLERQWEQRRREAVAQQQRQLEQERLRREGDALRQAEAAAAAAAPPPPTLEQLLAQVEARYQADVQAIGCLRMNQGEREAAEEDARQRALREADRVRRQFWAGGQS